MTPDGHSEDTTEYTNPVTVILCAVSAGVVGLAVGSIPATIIPGLVGFLVASSLAVAAYILTYWRIKAFVSGGSDA